MQLWKWAIPLLLLGAIITGFFFLQSEKELDPHTDSFSHVKAEKWVVLTSINYPTPAVKRLASLPGWQVVVVGDRKSPIDWNLDGCIFLDIETQLRLPYEIINLLPLGHYGRKNIGYLFAIQHGAKTIYETDDDNELLPGLTLEKAFPQTSSVVTYVPPADYKGVVNPYIYFGQPSTWPRGFPLSRIGEAAHLNLSYGLAYDVRVGVLQGLANGDPDMDAIFRLTRKDHGKKIDMDFDSEAAPIILPHQLMSPFNSQNTLFRSHALWGLLIPITTNFRVCDIWRGYWTQRLLWEIGSHLGFYPPSVQQDRNPHDYLIDFIDEIPLYQQGERLVDFLLEWKCKSESFFQCVLLLSTQMGQKGFWGEKDVELTRAWISDLRRVGYKEPPIRRESLKPVSRATFEPKQLPTSNLGDSLSLRSQYEKCN